MSKRRSPCPYPAPSLQTKSLNKIAASYRNPRIGALLQIADFFARDIRDALPTVRIVVGGSLRSKTAVLGKNDIDLRILLPQGEDSPEHMARVSGRLSKIIPFEQTIEKPYLALAYHHKKQLHVPNVGDLTLAANVQPARSYFGLAIKSARLPAPMRQRCLILKGQAWESGSAADYKQVKDRWAELIHWLTDRRYFSKSTVERQACLKGAKAVFPEFFFDPPFLGLKSAVVRKSAPA